MQGLNTPGALTDPQGKKPGWQKTFGDQDDRDLKFFDAVLATLKKDYKVDESRIYATGHSNGDGFTYLLWAARGDVLNDRLVRFAWQQRTIDELRKLNGCGEGKPWGEHGTLYPSKSGTPVVTYIHPGGHELPKNVPPVIVKFFQEHARR
jgi:polyhydroxybutyrate depolymerase